MSTWSRKDYEFFARTLHQAPIGNEERGRIVDDFTSEFRRDNPSFDGAKFADAAHRGKFSESTATQAGGWTTKTYAMTAKVLRRNKEETGTIGWHWLVTKFATTFGLDNTNFDFFKFSNAVVRPSTSENPFPEMERASRFAGRRSADIPVVSHLRRRPRKSIVDFAGHRIRVKEWPSSAGVATLRRHMKRNHPIRWRLSIRKGVRTRRRLREEAS